MGGGYGIPGGVIVRPFDYFEQGGFLESLAFEGGEQPMKLQHPPQYDLKVILYHLWYLKVYLWVILESILL